MKLKNKTQQTNLNLNNFLAKFNTKILNMNKLIFIILIESIKYIYERAI